MRLWCRVEKIGDREGRHAELPADWINAHLDDQMGHIQNRSVDLDTCDRLDETSEMWYTVTLPHRPR